MIFQQRPLEKTHWLADKIGQWGTTALVTHPDGLVGNWVDIKRSFPITPLFMKKPLPQNFTLTYDLVVPQNFTWGSKGLTLFLSKETSPGNAESFLNIKTSSRL